MADPLALWVVPVSEPGGVARHVLDTASAGIPGFRLAVLCPPGWLAGQLRSTGAAVLTGPFGPGALDALPRRGSGAAGALTTARAAAASSATLRHAVRTLRPAVVHSHLAYADLLCAAVLRGPRAPGPGHPALVSTEHGIAGDAALYHADPARARAMAALHTRRLRRTDARIAVSEATARAMVLRWHARDVTVIRNGIDRPRPGAAPRSPEAGSGPRLLSLARLAPEKNLAALVAATAALRAEHPGTTLTLAGDGPEHERLRALAASRGLADRVSTPGVVDPTRALAEHDVLVQLSRWENCSYSLLEAAAAGAGTVATDVGGNREILPARCLTAADPPGLADRVARLVAQQLDPAERPGLPPDWPAVAEMTSAVSRTYREVLGDTEVHA
ncbi:glycosyltransferase family 4 protein [Kocuria sp.]|uniref:glycosyltransferase family 4 protein n=1 Tax=Kocuria sp. TaxID=1871328 RepID=UPI0026DB0CFA|nr:glycosyltransferase family 4 protein [Kocuria sp.]MDO4919669.1 glycosyltransferase family 4 protein [Kocuria sp.]